MPIPACRACTRALHCHRIHKTLLPTSHLPHTSIANSCHPRDSVGIFLPHAVVRPLATPARYLKHRLAPPLNTTLAADSTTSTAATTPPQNVTASNMAQYNKHSLFYRAHAAVSHATCVWHLRCTLSP